jgi:Tfp pilus assembly protein PilN
MTHEAPARDAAPFTSTARLPRVDLMPREIAARRRERKLLAGLGAGLLAVIAVVVAVYVGAVHSEHQAQDSLDAADARHAQLQHQLGQLDDVAQTYAQESAREAQLKQALAPEVRWSAYLADLSLRIPHHVWLTNVSVTENVDDSNQVGAASTSSTGTPAPEGIGSVTLSGTAFKHDDVASWLDSLARERGYANPYFSSSTKGKVGDKDTVTFSSTVTLTKHALCGPTCAELDGGK